MNEKNAELLVAAGAAGCSITFSDSKRVDSPATVPYEDNVGKECGEAPSVPAVLPSFFRDLGDGDPQPIAWERVAALVRDDEGVRRVTERARQFLAAGDRAHYDRFKRRAGAITPSAACRGGHAMHHVTALTHVACVDLDDIGADRLPAVVAAVRDDPHTFMAWVTTSGAGVRVLFRYEGCDDHAAAWRAGNDYYAALTGIAADEHCKDVTRLSFLAHDAQLLYRPEAQAFCVPAAQPEAAPLTGRMAEEAFRQACALVEHEGLRYEPHHHNAYVMRVGYLLNRMGVSLPAAHLLFDGAFADYEPRQQVLTSCYRHTAEHNTRPGLGLRGAGREGTHGGTGAGTAAPRSPSPAHVRPRRATTAMATVHDMQAFLDTRPALRCNIVTTQTELQQPDGSWRELTDSDVSTWWAEMCVSTGKSVRRDDLWTLIHSHRVPDYDPFADYFASLPPYDLTAGRDALGELAAMVTVAGDQALFDRYLRKWMVAATASMLGEGLNQTILVLVGPQGIYKTTWLSRLLPPVLRRYFYTKNNASTLTKDDRFTVAEFAIVCLEELDTMGDRDLNQLKALVTMETVHERRPYDRVKTHRRHLASYCGTGNRIEFLTDVTGNRRWLPFEVTHIASPYEHPIDYDAVWGHALALLRDGFCYWITQQEVAEQALHNRRFEVASVERELLQVFYRQPQHGEQGVFRTASELMNRCMLLSRQPLRVERIGTAMRQLGYKPLRRGDSRGYIVYERTMDEIEREAKQQANQELSH